MRPRISKAVAGKPPRTHQAAEDRAAEDRTRGLIRQQWSGDPLLDNVIVGAEFYRSSRQVVDLDNLLKHVLDAATGVLWVNDCQVTAYDGVALELDREDPRTVLYVATLPAPTMVRAYGLDGKVRDLR
jgi:Holliday junction resolvase RusA-like endonuclease